MLISKHRPRHTSQGGDYGSAAVALEGATDAPQSLSDGRSRWSEKWLTRAKIGIVIFLAWTAFGVLQTIPEMLTGFKWPVFLGKVIDAWAWALLTPALLLMEHKLTPKEQNVPRLVFLFLLLSVPINLVHTYLAGLLLYPIPQIWWSPLRNSTFFVYFFIGGWVTYGAFMAALQAFRFYDRFIKGQLQLERVQRSLLEARLNALRLHLEPHFLFNTLNAISSEVAANPEQARSMIADLGSLLRRSLDCKDRAEISLAQELSVLDHYIAIQRVRFGDRIKIKVDVEPEMLPVMVPSMLLQPLVENAIRHGMERRISGGKVLVCASKAGEELQIRVIDDGVGLPRQWRMDSSTGHGVRVTRERLMALYPQAGDDCLRIRRREGGGTEAAVRIPLNRTNGDAVV